LPSIQKRRRLIGEAAAFADAPDLSPDVAERRQAVAEQYRAAVEDERRAASEIDRLSRQIDESRPSDAVLANEGRIEGLVSRIEVERKAQDDLRRRKTTMENAERTIRTRLREAGLEAGPEDFEHKVPAGPAGAVVRALIKEAAAIDADKKAIRDRLREHEGEAASIGEDLAGLPAEQDDGGLRTVLRALADRGDLEAQRAQKGVADSALRQEVQRRNRGLMLWDGTPEQLVAMRVPNGAAVDDFDRRFGAAENDVTRAGEEVGRLEGEERAIDAALAALARGEDVPTDEAVAAARGRRDEGWRLVRRIFVEGDDAAKAEAEGFDPGVPLANAYEATVAQADHVADRRLGEADRVSQFQQKTDDREAVRRNLADARARLAECREAARKLGDEWRGLWTGLAAEPQTPGVMRGWLQEREKACEAMSRLEVVEQEARVLDAEIAQYRRQLGAGLQALGEPQAEPDERLSALRSRAEEAVDRIAAAAAKQQQMMQRRRQLDVLLGTHRRDLAEVEERLASWRAKWEGAVRPFGRGADATAEEMEAVIQLIDDVRSIQRDWAAAQRQAAGIEKDYDLFSAECAAVAGLAAGDLADGKPFDVAAELGRRLRAAQTLRERRQGAEEELEKRRQECREAAARLSAAGGALDELLPLYQCASVDDLAAVEDRSRQKRALQDQLAAIENDLLDIGEGLPLDAIEAEAAAIDQPQLSAQIDAAGAQIDDIETRKTGLAHELGEKTEKLRAMDGGDAAARHAQEAENALAGLRRLSADYVRVYVAAGAIRGAIARARERLQGPVMQRAGGIFRDLTGGRFDGLRSDEDEKGQAMLFGLRSNGGTVSVGGMSDGTLDQLYLALRLAVIEHHLETRPAIPFVADDLLVNFDDERAGAAIDALGDLAQRTQVLFFTHHRHLAEMATARLGGDTAWVDLEAA